MSSQGQLDQALRDAAYNGQLQDVAAFLSQGAAVNSADRSGRTALMKAAICGHAEIVKILLDAGADRSLRDGHKETAEDDARYKGFAAVVDMLKHYNPDVSSLDEVTFTRSLGDRTLQEVFNFVTRERTSLIRVSAYGPVEAMAITPFSQIEDKSDTSLLRQAFDTHVKRGGTTDESLVFPGSRARLPKLGGGV